MYPQGIGQLSSPQQMPQQQMPQAGQMPQQAPQQMMPQQMMPQAPMPSPMPMAQPLLPEQLDGIGLNLAKTQENLKDLADGQLMNYLQTGEGAPPMLVLGELNRRKRMRDGAAQQPQATVADELLAEAMQSGIGSMTPRQGMREGGATEDYFLGHGLSQGYPPVGVRVPYAADIRAAKATEALLRQIGASGRRRRKPQSGETPALMSPLPKRPPDVVPALGAGAGAVLGALAVLRDSEDEESVPAYAGATRSVGPMSAARLDELRGTPEALAALYADRSRSDLTDEELAAHLWEDLRTAPEQLRLQATEDDEFIRQMGAPWQRDTGEEPELSWAQAARAQNAQDYRDRGAARTEGIASAIGRAEDPATAQMAPIVVTPRGVLPPGVSDFFRNRRDDIRYAWDKIPRFPRSDLTDEELAAHLWEDLRTAPEQLRLQMMEEEALRDQEVSETKSSARSDAAGLERLAARGEHMLTSADEREAARMAALAKRGERLLGRAEARENVAEPLPSSPRSGRSGVRGARPDVPRPDAPPRPRIGRSGARSPRLEDEVLPAEDTTPPAPPPAPPVAEGIEALAESAAASEAEPEEDPTPDEDNPLDTKTPFGRELRRAERSNINIPLMMAGLAMMSSSRPDFFGALGEGGVAGLKTLIDMRQQEDALMDREADRLSRAADRAEDRALRLQTAQDAAADRAADREARAAIARERAETQLQIALLRASTGGRTTSAQVNAARTQLDEVAVARGVTAADLLDYARDRNAHLAGVNLRGAARDRYVATLDGLLPFAEQYLALQNALIVGGGESGAPGGDGGADPFDFAPYGPSL